MGAMIHCSSGKEAAESRQSLTFTGEEEEEGGGGDTMHHGSSKAHWSGEKRSQPTVSVATPASHPAMFHGMSA